MQGNGSAAITPFMAMFTANGGRANEGRMMIDGLPVAASFNGGGVSTFIYDTPNADEMQVLVSGALGEAENGGPQVNIVPKAGGNRFQGAAFYSGAGTWSTGNNLNPTLISYGLTQPAGVISSWDASGSGGGPIKRDRLWFFANARKYSTIAPVPGAFANLNAGDASKWTYAKNPNVATPVRRFEKHLLGPADRSGDAEKPRVVFARVPVPVFGLDAVADRRRLPHVRIRLDRRREPDIVAGVVPRLPPFPVQRHAGDLAVAADEQAAARSAGSRASSTCGRDSDRSRRTASPI